ncbi:methyltransferase domain-containing protein [Subsaximicrobium wynnwilliamsii]|uniref:methyltransferase domain-containing protein n=1 Tax=Subsaximicrobium wynnwilliamsii TaxID=291179 RepID=UPI00167AFE54|nr:methyltransferase domain-containing protein [Subsaximicrobium wynnwilliamsii]
MNYEQTYNLLGNVDIYVIDQILKGRYQPGQSILDVGCGNGRNLKWFYQNDFLIEGIDADVQRDAGWVALRFMKAPESGTKFAQNNAYYLMAEMKKGDAAHSH